MVLNIILNGQLGQGYNLIKWQWITTTVRILIVMTQTQGSDYVCRLGVSDKGVCYFCKPFDWLLTYVVVP